MGESFVVKFRQNTMRGVVPSMPASFERTPGLPAIYKGPESLECSAPQPPEAAAPEAQQESQPPDDAFLGDFTWALEGSRSVLWVNESATVSQFGVGKTR